MCSYILSITYEHQDSPKYCQESAIEGSADQDQIAPTRSSLIMVCTVCHSTKIFDTLQDNRKNTQN